MVDDWQDIANRLNARIGELEAQLQQQAHAEEALGRRISAALDILRTPGAWSDFASRAIKALEGK